MILDTTFLIDLGRGHAGARQRFDAMVANGETLVVPAVALVEYLAGFEDDAATLDSLSSACRLLDFTVDDARRASRIVRRGFETGRFPGWNDAFIGASARRLGMSVVTRNPRHFPEVETVTY